MEIIKTSIEGLLIIKPRVFEDERGYFMESFKESFVNENFPDIKFIQDNESKSSYGVLRGLHFQKPPFEQTKLVRVISGKVLDVAVDLRAGSKTYGKHVNIELSDKNKLQFLIPKGFAHGFVVLSENAIFSYKVDNIYNSSSDSGIAFDDPDLKIQWPIPTKDLIISNKDSSLKSFKEYLIKSVLMLSSYETY
jgi:dTDP-4-dehydrorhamnose 3,5-epimerase